MPGANARVARQMGYGATACRPRGDGLRTLVLRCWPLTLFCAMRTRTVRRTTRAKHLFLRLLPPLRDSSLLLITASFRSANLSRTSHAFAVRYSQFSLHRKNSAATAENRAIHAVGRALRKGDRVFARRIRFVFCFLFAERFCSHRDFAAWHRRQTAQLLPNEKLRIIGCKD